MIYIYSYLVYCYTFKNRLQLKSYKFFKKRDEFIIIITIRTMTSHNLILKKYLIIYSERVL